MGQPGVIWDPQTSETRIFQTKFTNNTPYFVNVTSLIKRI